MPRACPPWFPLAALAAVLVSAPLAAQTASPAPAAAQPAAPPPLSVSGRVFGSYN